MAMARTGKASAIVMVIVGIVLPACAQFDGPATRGPGDGSSALANQTALAAKKVHEQNVTKYKDDANMLVLPGILANRREKWVRLLGRATGIGPKDPLEFFVIPHDSGKDYEALTVAFGKPSDVHQALLFIGMAPGRPVNYEKNQFWPKGERVLLTIEWEEAAADAKKPTARRVRVEDLVTDARTSKTLPKEGLVFTGSYWIQPENGGKPMYAADMSDSRSIASNYNERSTVLDVPWQWGQGEVYGSLKLSPDYHFAAGQPVQIMLEPEYKDGNKRVRELSLAVSMPAGKSGAQNAKYLLTDEKQKPAAEGDSLVHVLGAFGRIIEAGQDPFVTVQPDAQMTLRNVSELYALVQSMDKDGGIRVDAPPEGHLFYRAFFPKEDWRDRKKRLGRPWELHLGEQAGQVKGELILPADEIDNNGGAGDLKFKVSTAEEMAKVLVEKSDRWSQSVYIFAPPTMTYGAIMKFVRPSMKTHSTMYVFPNK
jgi:hypothetical protein